jgi:hypothetical protein
MSDTPHKNIIARLTKKLLKLTERVVNFTQIENVHQILLAHFRKLKNQDLLQLIAIGI